MSYEATSITYEVARAKPVIVRLVDPSVTLWIPPIEVCAALFALREISTPFGRAWVGVDGCHLTVMEWREMCDTEIVRLFRGVVTRPDTDRVLTVMEGGQLYDTFFSTSTMNTAYVCLGERPVKVAERTVGPNLGVDEKVLLCCEPRSSIT